MYVTNNNFNNLEEQVKKYLYHPYGSEYLVKRLIRLNDDAGFNHEKSPYIGHMLQYGVTGNELDKANRQSGEIRFPNKYCHKYYFAVMSDECTVTEPLQELVQDFLINKRNDLFFWTPDLVSLLIKEYDSRKTVSFIVTTADHLFALNSNHLCDFTDEDKNYAHDEMRYDLYTYSAVVTDCLPRHAAHYYVGEALYQFLIVCMGLCYGSANSWIHFFQMYEYLAKNLVCGEDIFLADISKLFIDVAYNMRDYSFPVERTYETYVGNETRKQPRLRYLQEVYTYFTDCNSLNSTFKNAVREYRYLQDELDMSREQGLIRLY